MEKKRGFQTACVHAGDGRNKTSHISTPICQSTNFEFPTPEDGAARAVDYGADEFYGRWGSVNAREFEALVAALEGANEAVCASSGLAVVSMIAHALLDPGDHFVGAHNCYSETKILLRSLAEQLSVDATFVDSKDPANFAEAIRPHTKMVFAETPANPTLTIVDIAEVARIVHRESDAALVVDSTFATPFNQRPLSLGADIVVHSASKYLGGHSDVIAGVCASRRELSRRVRKRLSFHGPTLDPFAAWLLCRGVRTLGLRMGRHNANGERLAAFLEGHPGIDRVYYPMLPSHEQHDLAARQMTGGGGMICFEINGGMEEALTLIAALRTIKMSVSLGGVDSIMTHPASMTHNLLPREEREKAGIKDVTLRLSVGIEDVEDLRSDLEQALDKVRQGSGSAPEAFPGRPASSGAE